MSERHRQAGLKGGRPRQVRGREWIESRIERVTESGCWIWKGSVTKTGYGEVTTLWVRPNPRVRMKAHRFVYELLVGSVDAPELRHLCNVKLCVNPAHLQPGTHAENMNDMALAGAPRAKLTEQDVVLIRRDDATGKDLAARFGVTPTAISYARNRRTYRWVA